MGTYYHRRPDGDYEQYDSYGDYVVKNHPGNTIPCLGVIFIGVACFMFMYSTLNEKSFEWTSLLSLSNYFSLEYLEEYGFELYAGLSGIWIVIGGLEGLISGNLKILSLLPIGIFIVFIVGVIILGCMGFLS